MESVAVDLFSHGGNNAVVRMPGRKFPGVLVQGDTLHSLWGRAAMAESALRTGGSAEAALDSLQMVVEDLDSMLRGYELALQAANMPLPYAER